MTSWHTKKAQKVLMDIFGKTDYDALMRKVNKLNTDPFNNSLNISEIKSFIKANLINKMTQKPASSSGFKSHMRVEDIMFDEKGPIGRLYHSPGTKSGGNFSKLIYKPLIKNRTKNIDDKTFREDCKKLAKKYLSLTNNGNSDAYKNLISAEDTKGQGETASDNAAPKDQVDEKTSKNWNTLKRKKNKDIIEKLKSDRLSNVLKTIVALIIYHWADTKFVPQAADAPKDTPQPDVQTHTPPKDLRRMNEWIDILSGKTVNSSGWRYKSGADMRKDSFDNLEGHHDYIQVFFPNVNMSQFANQDLYLDNDDFKDAWLQQKIADPQIMTKIQKEMKLNFQKMLTFWGFSTNPSITRIVPSKDKAATARRNKKICSGDHNNLRVTRVLLALKNFGLGSLATKFYHTLKGLNPESKPYWAAAIVTTPQQL